MKNYSRSAGVTLMELVIVLALIATLMGIGVGIFQRLELDQRAAVGLLKNQLRSARSAAQLAGVHTRVSFAANSPTIQTTIPRALGNWHFEDLSMQGAKRITAIQHGLNSSPFGRLGACLEFSGEEKQWAEFLLSAQSRDGSDGLRMECDLWLPQLQNAVLLEGEKILQVFLTDSGALEVEWFFGGELKGQRQLITQPGVLKWRQWQHLVVDYDRQFMRIFVDGIVQAVSEETRPLASSPGRIFLSKPEQKFYAKFDELKLLNYLQAESVTLPKGVSVAKQKQTIYFDGRGHLDPIFHSGVETIILQYSSGKQESIEIGSYGTIAN